MNLGTRLKVNIMSYDYCGYGQSSGKPNESNLNKACFACYEKMKERYNLRPEQIILYGQSIGTGKRHNYCNPMCMNHTVYDPYSMIHTV